MHIFADDNDEVLGLLSRGRLGFRPRPWLEGLYAERVWVMWTADRGAVITHKIRWKVIPNVYGNAEDPPRTRVCTSPYLSVLLLCHRGTRPRRAWSRGLSGGGVASAVVIERFVLSPGLMYNIRHISGDSTGVAGFQSPIDAREIRHILCCSEPMRTSVVITMCMCF